MQFKKLPKMLPQIKKKRIKKRCSLRYDDIDLIFHAHFNMPFHRKIPKVKGHFPQKKWPYFVDQSL